MGRPRGSLAGIVLLALALPMLLWQCDRHAGIAGKYQTAAPGASGRVPVSLELQADGKGIWSMETDNAPFRWDLYGTKIRLHTQSGGVIEGVVDQETIHLAMPGMEVLIFKRCE